MTTAALAVVSAGLTIRARTDAAEPSATTASARPLLVETTRVQASSGYAAQHLYTGRLVARRRSRLAFERLGRLDAVEVDDGDAVRAGQLLATLDTRHLVIQLAEVDARVAEATARLAEMVAGPRAQVIAGARARVADWAAQVERSRLQTARRRRLVATDAASREELERSSYETDALEARREAARQELSELEEGTRREIVAAQRARVGALEAQRDAIRLEIAKSRLLAPFAGRIERRHADDGSVLQPGEVVLTLVESAVLEARIGLPPAIAGNLEPDDAARLTAGGRPVEARVVSVEAALDPSTRTLTAVFRVEPSAAAGLVPGRIVRLVRSTPVEEPGFWLPRTALVKGVRGLWSCLVAAPRDGGHALARRAVEILHEDDGRVFVRGTLRPGEAVVTSGTHRVVEGQPVRVRGD